MRENFLVFWWFDHEPIILIFLAFAGVAALGHGLAVWLTRRLNRP